MEIVASYFTEVSSLKEKQKEAAMQVDQVRRIYSFKKHYDNITRPELWQRLEDFDFELRCDGTKVRNLDDLDDGNEFSILGKLSSAEGWPQAYTLVAIEEYRRFLYLAQIADFQVTPSVPIDKVWHMHLTFTREYWDVLCSKVLCRPFHHEPCLGADALPRYIEQYRLTKELYRSEFGQDPPSNVWQSPANSNRYSRLAKVKNTWIPRATFGLVLALAAFTPIYVAVLMAPIAWLIATLAGDQVSIEMSEIGPGAVKNRSGGGGGACGGCGGGCGGCGGL